MIEPIGRSDELQIIGVYADPAPSFRGMFNFALGLVIRAFYALRRKRGYHREGRYSHLFIRRGQWLGESGARSGWTTSENGLARYDPRAVPGTVCEAFRVPADRSQDEAVVEAAYTLAERGAGYDLAGGIWIAADELGLGSLVPHHGPEYPAVKCSVAVALCYLAAGIDLAHEAQTDFWRFAPADLSALRAAGSAEYRGTLTWPVGGRSSG